MHLGKVVQRPKEALRYFFKRFSIEALHIQDLNAGVALDAFMRGLRPRSFKFDLVKKKIATLKPSSSKVEKQDHTKVASKGKAAEKKKTK